MLFHMAYDCAVHGIEILVGLLVGSRNSGTDWGSLILTKSRWVIGSALELDATVWGFTGTIAVCAVQADGLEAARTLLLDFYL